MSTYKQPNAEHNQGIKISVITVCKNSEAHIEKAIQSVINQTYQNIEYIIIDGDSQDKTKDIIQKYSKYIAKFISEPDTGIYNAMNKGIKLATGSFIQFLNSDDYFYDNNVVEDVVQFIRQNPDCDIVYGDAEIRPDPRMGGEPFIAKSPLPLDVPDSLIIGHFFLQGSMFFRSNCFEMLGNFNEKYKIAGDYEFYLRILDLFDNILLVYINKTIFSYSESGCSKMNIKKTLEEMFYIQNNTDSIDNYWDCQQRIEKFQQKIIELNIDLTNAWYVAEERKCFIQNLKDPKILIKLIILRLLKIISNTRERLRRNN